MRKLISYHNKEGGRGDPTSTTSRFAVWNKVESLLVLQQWSRHLDARSERILAHGRLLHANSNAIDKNTTFPIKIFLMGKRGYLSLFIFFLRKC